MLRFFSRGLIRWHEGSLRESLVEILEDDRALVDSLACLGEQGWCLSCWDERGVPERLASLRDLCARLVRKMDGDSVYKRCVEWIGGGTTR